MSSKETVGDFKFLLKCLAVLLGVPFLVLFFYALVNPKTEQELRQQRIKTCIDRGYVPMGSPFSEQPLKDYCKSVEEFRSIAKGMEENDRQAKEDLTPQ